MKFLSRHWVSTALLTSMILGLSACSDEPAAPPAAAPMAPTVSVAEVLSQRLTEWDEFTGRLQAPEQVELRPRVSGYIDAIAFSEGALVQAGQPLFYIDAKPFQMELNRLQAQRLDAQAQLQLAQQSFDRARALKGSASISEELFDQRQTTLAQAKAQLASVQASLDLAELNLSYTTVRAPISGRISRANVTRGNYVAAGQNVLTRLVSTDKVYAYFDADEQTYLKYIRLANEGSRPSARDVQQPVQMALANERDFGHQGVIDFIDNQVNPATGTIRGRAVFANERDQFVPGLFARIRLSGSASYDGILIDDKAIGTDLNNKFVLVVDGQNSVHYRPVVMGEKLNGLRIIRSGLSAGERIIVNGLQRVRPGVTVNAEAVAMASAAQQQQLATMQARVDAANQALTIAQAGERNVTGG
ncbi:efflux RND transporter periplasmic adaptor subunit [uncultured Ferrimonas sp.]|uniref:efflux RND transporter periplasmic adaptor subunit n=1 Tax=uncultured Ferrimonas sp. TaxID=432640 RepID=UPI002634668E|nr:efflux RND transporter periplasmic adaptor subunit [uncultured Ferrimonas sp.]